MYQISQDPEFRNLEKRILWKVINGAKLYKDGVYFDLPDRGMQPLTGFSHGTSGVGYTIAKFSKVSGEKCSSEILRMIQNHELNDGKIVSPDYRMANRSQKFWGWCHGPIGTMLFLEIFADKEKLIEGIVDEYLRYLEFKKKSFGNMEIGLCHGIAGNLYVLNRVFKGKGAERERLNRCYEEFRDRILVERMRSSGQKDMKNFSFFLGYPGFMNILRDIDCSSLLVPDTMLIRNIDEFDILVTEGFSFLDMMRQQCSKDITMSNIKNVTYYGEKSSSDGLQKIYEHYLRNVSEGKELDNWYPFKLEEFDSLFVQKDVFVIEYEFHGESWMYFLKQIMRE